MKSQRALYQKEICHRHHDHLSLQPRDAPAAKRSGRVSARCTCDEVVRSPTSNTRSFAKQSRKRVRDFCADCGRRDFCSGPVRSAFCFPQRRSVTEFYPELCVSVGNQFLNRRSYSELRTAEIKAFSDCFLVGMDVAVVRVKGTNDGRDECDKRILLHMPELAWHQKV